MDFNIYEFDYQQMHFALFRVQVTRNTPVSFREEPFIRIGSYKKKLDDHPEKERQIWNSEKYYSFERDIAIHHVTEDEVLTLIDYPAFFELLKVPLPDSRKGIIEKLMHDKIINTGREDYHVTNLGLLLFARDIHSHDNLARKALRVIFYEGDNRGYTKKEQLGKKGYAVGFDGLIKYPEDNLPSTEIIDKALRKNVSMYPTLAIRELIANAIIY